MEFVVKIKFENTLRRLTVERGKDGSVGLTFIGLVAKVHDIFQISADERLVLTYIDQDNDLVTMGDDHDLYDAWIIQRINPLRINVSTDDSRKKERKEAFDKFLSAEAILKLHENSTFIGRDLAEYLKFSKRQEEYDARRSYSIEIGKARRDEPSSRGCKHHHRMKRFVGGGSSFRKLDARFVCDVTIFDGTEVVCGTHFTKVWRLRNTGTCPWPRATLLVYTGGDLLGTKQSALIELPEKGLPCEEEMNIAVDFVAPGSPGRYVSHWRLRAPSGQKFGQRVWVLIKAVSKCMETDIPHASKGNTLHQESLY